MATLSAIEARIMARFDAIEARLSDIETRLNTVDHNVSSLDLSVGSLDTCIDNLRHDLSDRENLIGAIDELAEEARRRERQQWLRESRAAMGRAS